MTDNLIATDKPLTPEVQQILSAILDTLIPASDDGVMPSAGKLDLMAHLKANDADFLQTLPEVVSWFDADFARQTEDARHALLTQFSEAQPELFDPLLHHAYQCYYQDDQVLIGIGSKAGPPFPQGNALEPGDLSLLDPVLQGDHKYRS
ncbi:MAG: hypothetical protein GKR90_10885 [Pseudomonadales bacterium]|nr:hypothetical protein [Pseudomonadales bacterium]